MGPALTLSRQWHVPHQLRLHHTRLLIGHCLNKVHEGSLHAANAVYTCPPIFLPAEGQVASNVPILASLPMLSLPILAFSVTAHCAEYMFQLSTSFQRRPKAFVELTFVRQASSFRFLRIREYPANEMSQTFAFRHATPLSSLSLTRRSRD